MSITKLISNYTTYNEWANNKIIDWLKNIDTAMLYKQTPSSFNTIDYTLQHILSAQKFWLTFISGEDISTFNWGVRELEIENLLTELEIVSAQMKNKFSAFTEEELNDKLELHVRWVKNNLCRYEYIMHVINHSTYHRGQIVTMAHSLGIKDGITNTDYNF